MNISESLASIQKKIVSAHQGIQKDLSKDLQQLRNLITEESKAAATKNITETMDIDTVLKKLESHTKNVHIDVQVEMLKDLRNLRDLILNERDELLAKANTEGKSLQYLIFVYMFADIMIW